MLVKRSQISTCLKASSFWSVHGTLYFRNEDISQETQVASIEGQDDPFKILAGNVNDLKWRKNVVVDD